MTVKGPLDFSTVTEAGTVIVDAPSEFLTEQIMTPEFSQPVVLILIP
ncbi:MAG: hypothetical protein OSB15_11445 [Amylibacter sp.]|nr:hypothetical protein [Amylibacter sp.]